jgi:DNA invertase Pin-like site-specific DNA recombinase
MIGVSDSEGFQSVTAGGRQMSILAAQYVRMSTDLQQYSIENQKEAILQYALQHEFAVIKTYTDAGKSGVVLKSRAGLKELLADVLSGNAIFKAILVYDVSRWGRFQDSDEAAHYEFICKNAGIPVHYCAELFQNDGTLPNSIFKSLKRMMAAEYSRELGVKVFGAQKKLAQLGFRMGGTPGYGLRRMLVSNNPKLNRRLDTGQRKDPADHTILAPGPRKEVECVRAIYAMALTNLSMSEIAA